MSDPVDSLLIDVRANTQGFASDVAAMRSAFDGTLVEGFERAGHVLERGLLNALRKGSIGFEDLRRIALSVVNSIAGQAMSGLMGSLGLGGAGAGFGSLGGGGGSLGGGSLASLLNLSGIFSSLFGMPGRATGGPVSPGRGYLVGERGPELFVPTSAWRIEAGHFARPRDVRVAITVSAPPGTSAPQALQRSGRQVASAVRRALSEF